MKTRAIVQLLGLLFILIFVSACGNNSPSNSAEPLVTVEKSPAGALVEDFAGTTGWVDYHSSGQPVFVEDATIAKTGSSSLKLQQTRADGDFYVSRYKVFATPQDFSATDRFYLWTYWPNGNAAGSRLIVYLSSDAGSFANVSYVVFDANTTGWQETGWNLWEFLKADFRSERGNLDWGSIKTIMFKLHTISATDSVNVDSLFVGGSSRAKLIMSMDDGALSQFEATKIANSFGIPVTLYVIPNLINTTNAMTLDQLRFFYAGGNDLGVHHENDLTALADNGQVALMESRKWLMDNGFTRSADMLAWPMGRYNDRTIEAAKMAGIVSARGVTASPFEVTVLGLVNPWVINAVGLNKPLTLATAKEYVDKAIADGTTVTFLSHLFGTGADSLQWDINDFTNLCSYIHDKVQQGQIDVITHRQFYNSFSTPR